MREENDEGLVVPEGLVPADLPNFSKYQLRRPELYSAVSLLRTVVRARLWGDTFDTARAGIAEAAKIARALPQKTEASELVYLGEGLGEAQRFLSANADEMQSSAAELLVRGTAALSRPATQDTAWVSAKQAYELLLPFYGIAVEAPQDEQYVALAELVAAAQKIVDPAEAEEAELSSAGRARITLNRIARGLPLWKALSEGAETANGLPELYDELTEIEHEGGLTWKELPRYELLIALDRLNEKKIPVELSKLRTLPAALIERGGWWEPKPRPRVEIETNVQVDL